MVHPLPISTAAITAYARNYLNQEDILPIIRVEMFPGRSPDQKRALVRELTDGFIRSAGGKPESIHVVITEVEPGNWGSGGMLASDKAKS